MRGKLTKSVDFPLYAGKNDESRGAARTPAALPSRSSPAQHLTLVKLLARDPG
jgi:hypothetical protein